MKKIIAFKGDGQILMVGDFEGQLNSKYIQNDNKMNIKDIVFTLLDSKSIQLSIRIG